MENNGQKTAMMVDPFNASEATGKISEPKITQTKESKTIEGRKCSKIIVESESTVSDMWITSDAGLGYQDLYRIFNSTKGTPGASNVLPASSKINGFPVEILSKDKKSGAVSASVRISGISKTKVDPSIFNMDGYQIVDMTKKSR
jgi:hypothetical protein